MDAVTVEAPAKLNLRLLVGPLRDDGYHGIRSLMVALDGLADTVTVRAAKTRSVSCAGVAERDNLAWRALDVLERRAGRALACRVEIEKRIPVQAGLGGGSSDAAAALIAANRLFDLGLDEGELEAAAADVGSDVAFFVRRGAQWAEGRGERLAPVSMPSFAAVIVVPPFGLSTPEVYRAFDALAPSPADDGTEPPAAMPELASWVRNDLWPAATALRPELTDVAGRLREAGAGAALLCGSGSAVAGLFRDVGDARAAVGRDLGATFVVSGAPAGVLPVSDT